LDGIAVTLTVRADGPELVSAGADILVDVDAAGLSAGSDTVKANVELVLKPSSVGLNFSPTSCATVKVSPRVTGVMPSASTTVPCEGNAVTVTTKADEAKLVSVGAGIAIGVAKLFSATVSDFELAVNVMAYSTAELFCGASKSNPLVRSPKEGRVNKKGSVLMRTF
jgi:hypothetical protein